MIRGETVGVSLLVLSGGGRMGVPTRSYAQPFDVENVVVAPATDDEIEPTRPDGIRSVYTLHFPRGFSHDLRGAKVTVRGIEYRVIGDPAPYTEANVRGPWTMPVRVGRSDG